MAWQWKRALALIFSLCSIQLNAENLKFAKKKIQIGGKILVVEIADTPQLRARGLMNRQALKEDEGMLFVFDHEEIQRFWMKNTYIPLSIGFFDKNKKLVDIQHMEPIRSVIEIPKVYISQKPAQYALEVNQGWFDRKKVFLNSKFRFAK